MHLLKVISCLISKLEAGRSLPDKMQIKVHNEEQTQSNPNYFGTKFVGFNEKITRVLITRTQTDNTSLFQNVPVLVCVIRSQSFFIGS